MPSSSNTERVERTEAALRYSEAIKTAILEAALDAIVTINHEGQVLDFNPAAERMFGFTRAEALGQEMAELIIPVHLRDRHRAGLQRAVSTGRDTIVGQRIEISAVRKSGEEFPVELAITRIRTGDGPPLFTGHIRDISERKRAELRRAAQLAVARVLAEAASLAEATPRILQAVCECLNWDVGAIWRMDDDADVLRCVDLWCAPGLQPEEFARATRQMTCPRAVGLPGRIWASGEPCWIPDVVPDANFPRAPLASQAGLHGAFGFPIRLGAQVLGVIEFFSRQIRQPDAEVLEMFATIGSQIGQFIERKRAEEDLRQLNADLERRIADRTAELSSANGRLRESEERFSKAFRASPVFVSIARLNDGRFIEVNEAFLQSSGWSRAEVIGRTSAELKLWQNLEERGRFLFDLQLRGFIRNRECAIRSKDGRTDTVLLSAELIEIDGKPHILAVGLDITARKQAEEELRRTLEKERELSQLKSNFVSLVSHEFRTPLGIIMSAAEILEHYLERLAPERRREHLRDIHDASRRMSELMDEVLLLARMEADKTQCKPSPIDLRALCERLVEDVVAASGGIGAIRLSVRPLTGLAQGDELLLRHIFTNLLSNAVKYSPAGQTVEFTVERRETDAVIEVRDHGIGIPESDQIALFETFHRGSNVGERPGTGLGLVIVKRCVALHGGNIGLRSEENQGTTVTVRLPLFPAGATGRAVNQKTKSVKAPAPAARPRRRAPGRRKSK